MDDRHGSVGKLIVTALISFVATNADDLVILMNFFTQVSMKNSKMKVLHVFIGQYIGFALLLVISLVGYVVSFVLPVQMVGFLGFVPILLGLKQLVSLVAELYKARHGTIDDIIPCDPVSTVQLEAIRYYRDSDKEVVFAANKQEGDEHAAEGESTDDQTRPILLKCLRPIFTLETLQVISITVANSADNIAIYTPLFSQALYWQIILYIVIFLFMVLLWLLISYYFINYRPILNIAQKCARYVVPLVFVGIGIYIVVTSDCFPWLVQAIKTKSFKNG